LEIIASLIRTVETVDRRAGEDLAILDLLVSGVSQGKRAALVTLLEVEGGSSRPVGAQMAVLSDGRYCGHLDGGCVEAAIAAEAIAAICEGRDRLLRLGTGSPYLDISLPCGGSIEMHIHVDPEIDQLRTAIDLTRQRQTFALELFPAVGRSRLVHPIRPYRKSGWRDDAFLKCYAPATRLLAIGKGAEFERLIELGSAAAMDCIALSANERGGVIAEGAGVSWSQLTSSRDIPALSADPWTAVVFLFHDHEWETALMLEAIRSQAFFIGAMGSHRAHEARVEALLTAGAGLLATRRIKSPVGLFGPARDATALALSILADVMQARMRIDGLD
jgi:xanthine dehydrogenase accessory factor